jgi:hypothetical protein
MTHIAHQLWSARVPFSGDGSIAAQWPFESAYPCQMPSEICTNIAIDFFRAIRKCNFQESLPEARPDESPQDP